MEANDASSGSGDATTRAQQLRTSLGARQDAETLVAEASKIRQEAAAAADALVAEAQTLSAQLVRESRALAEEATSEARERADGILARARLEAEELTDRARATAESIRVKAENEVEEHRRRVLTEVTEQVTRELNDQHHREVAAQREQAGSLLSDIEASVRILGVSLETALSNVGELLGSVEGLRTASEGGSPPAGGVTVPQTVSTFSTQADTDPRPARPRTATEAFLSSSSMEVEQSSRELRDLQAPEEVRQRRGEESRREAQRRELKEGLADEGDPDPADDARPLGWLFRTAQ